MMCFIHYGCLNRWTCCGTHTLPGFYDLFTMDASQMDLLLHMDTISILCLFAMDDSTEEFVVAHGHCCYVIDIRIL